MCRFASFGGTFFLLQFVAGSETTEALRETLLSFHSDIPEMRFLEVRAGIESPTVEKLTSPSVGL